MAIIMNPIFYPDAYISLGLQYRRQDSKARANPVILNFDNQNSVSRISGSSLRVNAGSLRKVLANCYIDISNFMLFRNE